MCFSTPTISPPPPAAPVVVQQEDTAAKDAAAKETQDDANKRGRAAFINQMSGAAGVPLGPAKAAKNPNSLL